MSFEIKYFEGDENAQENMYVQSFVDMDPAGSDYGNTDYIQNGAPDIPYATLEKGVWKLDGTRKIMSAEGKFFICGNVDEILEVGIYFSETMSPANISLSFSPSTNQWPSKVEIRVSETGGFWESFEISPGSPEMHFRYYDETLDDVNNKCDRVIIRLCPKDGQRVKIRKITAGIEKTYGDKELSNVNLVTEFDPSLASLPTDTLSFNAHVNEMTNFVSRDGNKVKLYKNGNLEHTMWIKEIERISKTQYRINCQSLIGNLDRKYYGKILSPGGEIDGFGRCGNAWSYAKTVLEHISKNGVRFSVNYTSSKAKVRGDKILIGYLPICQEKDAVQQVLFASGLVPSTMDGTMNLSELQTEVKYEFTDDDIISNKKARKMKPISVLEVYTTYEKYIEQNWSIADIKGKIDEIPRIAHVLPKPNWGDIIEEGVDYGAGWVSGIIGIDTLDQYIEFIKLPESRRLYGDGKNDTKLTIDHCTLIHDRTEYESQWPGYPYDAEYMHSDVLEDVFERMGRYVGYRIVVEQDVIVTTQHAGDYVRTMTPWGTTVEGWIISMDSTLTRNGHRAKIKVLGKEVS